MISSFSLRSYRYVLVLLSLLTQAYAGIPVWTFTPLTPTTLTLTIGETTQVQYQITNQSHHSHRLVLTPIPGLTQITTPGNCQNPFVLSYQESCVLTLAMNANTVTQPIIGGPKVCQDGNPMQCYQPSQLSQLAITLGFNPIHLSPTMLPAASDNLFYSQTLSASGGIAPYTYTSTTLPLNLTLDPTTGVLSGVLVSQGNQAMTYSFTVTVTDANGTTAMVTYQLQANPNSTVRFTVPGSYLVTVPTGTTRLVVTAIGGGGGGGGNGSGKAYAGGAGCIVTSTIQALANQSFMVVVGGGGGPGATGTNGFYGASGGGGGSTNLTLLNNDSLILIAGGGGGAGGSSNTSISTGGIGCQNLTAIGGAGGDALPCSGGAGGQGGVGGTGGTINGNQVGASGNDGDGGAGGAGGSNGPNVPGGQAGTGVGNGMGGSSLTLDSGGGGGGYGGGGGGCNSSGGGAGGSGVADPNTITADTQYAPADNGGPATTAGGNGSVIINFE